MIQKLRKRFILIMMALVTLVLLITFSILVINSAQQLKETSVRSLTEGYTHLNPTVETPFDEKPVKQDVDNKKPFDSHVPASSFYVTLDDANAVTAVEDFNNDIAQTDVQAAVENAIQQNKDEGTIGSMGLRYIQFESTDEETVFGFIDIIFEQNFIRSQIISYTLIGLGSLAAFFVISLILSKLAIRPIDRAWKKQQRFIADASHELKTPITIMLANTSILLSGKGIDRAESDKWLSHIDLEARHMKKLVEDLLFLARVDGKNGQAPMTRIDLSDTALQSVLPFEPVMFESGKELLTDIEQGLCINGDASQIKQLISILLDNAQKYADPQSKISFRLKAENGKALLAVHNAADPIDAKDLPYLFDRFYRIDQARTRGTNSYGLGLSIAKEIVSMHKGKLSVASDKQTGTTFTIALPLV